MIVILFLILKRIKQLTKFRIHSFVELSDDLQSLPYVKGEGEMIG
jgi:hypothetical protein